MIQSFERKATFGFFGKHSILFFMITFPLFLLIVTSKRLGTSGYLGVDLSSSLERKEHIDRTMKKANSVS